MQVQAGQFRIAAHLYDGYQVHRAVLSRGLQTLALPRQVLLAGRSTTVPSEISFTHGVPEASTVSGVTYAQDRRLRRALLERARVPVPKGATFTWRNLENATRWAENIGYPVVVKEMVGENPSRSIPNVRSADQVEDAFRQLRLRQPEDRSPGSNPLIAGYATTRLGYVLDDDGTEVAPLRTRFLIEKQVEGQVVRAMVTGSRVVAAVLRDPAAPRDILEQLHPGFTELLVRTSQAVPGLAMTTIDLVVDDFRRDPASQSCVVVELSERPRAETFLAAGEQLGDRIGDALVELQAEQAGLPLRPLRQNVTASLVIEGLRDAASVAVQIPAKAEEYGVELAVVGSDEIDGELQASASGEPQSLSMLVELLMAGYLLEDRAAAVEYVIEDDHV